MPNYYAGWEVKDNFCNIKHIKTRKVSCLRHQLRNQKYQIAQLIMRGKIERKGVGRWQISWTQNIRNLA